MTNLVKLCVILGFVNSVMALADTPLGVFNYKGGLEENTSLTITPTIMKFFELKIPSSCGIDVLEISASGAGQSVAVTPLEKNLYSVNDAKGASVDTISASFNGAGGLQCAIPVYNADGLLSAVMPRTGHFETSQNCCNFVVRYPSKLADNEFQVAYYGPDGCDSTALWDCSADKKCTNTTGQRMFLLNRQQLIHLDGNGTRCNLHWVN